MGVTHDRILRQNVNTEAVRKFRRGLQVLGETDALWILNGKRRRICCFTGRAGLISHHTPSVSFKPGTVSSCYSVSELSLHLAPRDTDSSALSLSTTPLRLLCQWLPATLYYEYLGEPQGALSVSLPPSPPSPTSIKHAKNHGKCPTNTATPAPSCEGWSDPDQAKRHQP